MSSTTDPNGVTIIKESEQCNEATAWLNNVIAVIAAVFLYSFMEWLFYVTKPSFLSLESWPGKSSTLIVSAIFISAGLAIISSMIFLLTKIISNRRLRIFLRNLFPAFILASLSLLLIDNFTYTLFGFGISTSETISRAIYLVVFICLLVLWQVQVTRLSEKLQKLTSKLNPKLQRSLVIGLPIILLLLTLPFLKIGNFSMPSISSEQDFPNIVIFTADGLNSDHLSLYGYERDTSPFLNSIAGTTFFSTNHF